MNHCLTPYCINLTKHKYCEKCKKKAYRQKYPMRAAYQNKKNNAHRDGIEFSLTLAEFEMFCYQTKLLMGRGRSKNSYTIDRIWNWQGYHLGNIQVLTRSKNSSKGNKLPVEYLEYDWETGIARVVKPLYVESQVTPF